jgi:hypothetical protein
MHRTANLTLDLNQGSSINSDVYGAVVRLDDLIGLFSFGLSPEPRSKLNLRPGLPTSHDRGEIAPSCQGC